MVAAQKFDARKKFRVNSKNFFYLTFLKCPLVFFLQALYHSSAFVGSIAKDKRVTIINSAGVRTGESVRYEKDSQANRQFSFSSLWALGKKRKGTISGRFVRKRHQKRSARTIYGLKFHRRRIISLLDVKCETFSETLWKHDSISIFRWHFMFFSVFLL